MNVRSVVGGTTLLVVLMTAGAAQGLSGSNTVYTDDIVNGQVYGADVHDGSLTAADLASGSVTSAKLGTGSVSNAKLATNAVTGAKIATGTIDRSKMSFPTTLSFTYADDTDKTSSGGFGAVSTATCPPGTHVVSGGVRITHSDDPNGLQVYDSWADFGANTWNVKVKQQFNNTVTGDGGMTATFHAQVYCVSL